MGDQGGTNLRTFHTGASFLAKVMEDESGISSKYQDFQNKVGTRRALSTRGINFMDVAR